MFRLITIPVAAAVVHLGLMALNLPLGPAWLALAYGLVGLLGSGLCLAALWLGPERDNPATALALAVIIGLLTMTASYFASLRPLRPCLMAT